LFAARGGYPSRVLSARAPAPTAAVIDVTTIDADRAARVLHALYPHTRISVDRASNAIIVIASADAVNAMRAIVSGIDIKNPGSPITDAEQLHSASPKDVIAKMRVLFPRARFVSAPNRTVVISASQNDLAQIRAVMTTLDTPLTTPAPTPAPAIAVGVTQRSAREIARAVAAAVPHVRVSVAGSQLLLRGSSDDVDHAKALVAQLDEPQAGVQYTQVYRLRFIDAASVADLLKRSFRNVQIQADADLNAITVLATPAVHRRIADAIAQLDAGPGAGNAAAGAGGLPVGQPGTSAGYGGLEVVSLKAAVPGQNGAPSTSATDIATTVTQALSTQAPDLKVTVPPNSTQLILTGSPYSIKLAKDLIAQLDVAQPLVVLDTEVLEVDEQVAKNLGLQIQTPVVSTTFAEIGPTPDPLTGASPPLMRLHGFSRTTLSVGAQLNLLIQNGKARILSDPRITTISGRTASIRAGDTISILTTTGGGAGTVATTQLQSFQTGVTLDITPVVNAGNFISVTIHPTVNNLSGILNGVPQISTRDTLTTVDLKEDQTLVIGGLIEDSVNNTENKIPIAGDLPLVGRLFRSEAVNRQRNELVITVTPHILTPGESNVSPGPPLPAIPTAQPLPTLPPGTRLFAAPARSRLR
jgi:type II secretory pathway component GspD/PulD (secretin)